MKSLFVRILSEFKQAVLAISVIAAICFYILATLDTEFAIIGGWFSIVCVYLNNKTQTPQEKKVAFRTISILAGGHVALVPAIILSWLKRTESPQFQQLGLFDLLWSVLPISFVIFVGSLIALAVKDAAQDYAERNQKRPRFVHRFQGQQTSRPVRNKSPFRDRLRK